MTTTLTKAIKAKAEENRQAYVQTFSGVLGEAVLDDLARFCRADESCFNPDPRVHAMLEGRREVYLHIMKHLKLSPEDLAKSYTPK